MRVTEDQDDGRGVRRAVRLVECDAERCGRLEHADVALVVKQLGLSAAQTARLWAEIRATDLLISGGAVDTDEAERLKSQPAAERPVEVLLYQTRRHRLLTQDEEVRLSRTARLARNVEEVADPAATDDALCDAGQNARERLILANIRLVLWWARRRPQHDEALEDTVQRGVLGLMRAADGFDPELGFRFSTYASQAVERQLFRPSRGGRGLRLPQSRHRPLSRIRKARRELRQQMEREPTPSELVEASGESSADVALLLATEHEWVSVDQPANPQSPRSAPRDTMPDPDGGDPHELVCLKEEMALLASRLTDLDDRTRTIVMHRFGLGGDEVLTLQELGDRLGLTKERVRQIELEALGQLARAFGVEPPARRRQKRAVAPNEREIIDEGEGSADAEDEQPGARVERDHEPQEMYA